eukprot:403360954
MTNSTDCNINCLAKGNEFCLGSTMKSGNCCSPKENKCSPGGDQFCSRSAYQFGLKAQACPLQQNCGTQQTFTPASYTTALTIKLDQQTTIKFTKDSLCYYTIQFPSSAQIGDVIYANFIIIQNAKIYMYVGESIKASYVSSCNPQQGDYLISEYPNKMYLTFVSTSNDVSSYFQVNLQLSKYKTQNYNNELRCAGVSNVKPTDGSNGNNNTSNNQTNNQTSNVIYNGLSQLTIPTLQQRISFDQLAQSRYNYAGFWTYIPVDCYYNSD